MIRPETATARRPGGRSAARRASSRASSPSSARSRWWRRATADGAFAAYDLCDNEPPRPHPRRHPRPGRASRATTEREAIAIAERDRRGARLCRRAGGRDVRRPRRRRASGRRQRDRAAGPQFRPLDDRGRRDLAVRAACPRRLRLAARLAGAPRPDRDAEPDRRTSGRLARAPRRAATRISTSTARPKPGRAARWATSRACLPERAEPWPRRASGLTGAFARMRKLIWTGAASFW